MDNKYPTGLTVFPPRLHNEKVGELKLAINIQESATEWSRWYLIREKNRKGIEWNCIKRCRKVNGKLKWERYPAKNYRSMNEDELKSLLRRLNATFETKKKLAEERYKFHHAYINTFSLSAFEKHLNKQTTVKASAAYPMVILQKYAFDFFIIKHDLADPSKWHLKEDDWAEWLLDQEFSSAVLKRIISTTNRFLKFLTQKVYPEMPTPRKLEPIGRAKFSEINYRRKKSGKDDESKYIPADIYKKILKAVEDENASLLPNVKLCYAFGLRINESLGFSRMKLLKESLLVDEQGAGVKDGKIVTRKVKTNSRKVPYWNMAAKEAWALIQQIVPMHPNTLNKKVNKILKKLGHSSHDFRRTFITNAHRKFHWKDVQQAAGHTTHQMTMKYDQDDRQFSTELADLGD